jgi:hypothetical protein
MFVASWQPAPTHRFGRLYALGGRRPTLLTIILCVIACAPTGCEDSKKREEGRALLAQQVAEQLQAAKAKAVAYDFDGANAILRDLAEDVNKSPFADVATYDKLIADIDAARRRDSEQESEYRKKLRGGWKIIDARLASPAEQERRLADKKRREEEEEQRMAEARARADEARLAAAAKAQREAEAREEERRRAELQTQKERARQTKLDPKTVKLVEKYIEAEKKATVEEIKRLRKQNNDYKEAVKRWKAKSDARPKQKSEAVDTLAKVIDANQKEIKQLQDGKRTIPPTLPYARLSVDDVGSFIGPLSNRFAFTVFQVLDASNFLMEIRFKGLDDLPMDEQVGIVGMRGVQTNRLADGKEISPVGVYRITGNQTYQSAMGAQRTVYVAEPIDIETLKEQVSTLNEP